MQRRQFLGIAAGSAVSSALGLAPADVRASDRGVFLHGIASGDPLHDRVILWTRVSGVALERIELTWQVATDPDMRRVVTTGSTVTGPERDYTVKVDVVGLDPATEYFYRFAWAKELSAVGRTRTLPDGSPEAARFAVVSCSNYPYGFFHVYKEIAADETLDAVIHLGDYFYEYGMGGYATEYAEALGRVPDPLDETVSLSDYRARHAQYKLDPDSQAMLAMHPLIAVWDDHEVANDAWRGGAQNHEEEEGSYLERVRSAVQAYFEWMPIRGTANGVDTRIFRRFDYGDLASLLMLDTRLFGRDAQPDAGGETDPEVVGRRMQDPNRRLLGSEQEGWLADELANAGTTWQLIGQQIMVAPTRSPDLTPLIDLESNDGLSRDELEQYIAVSKSNPPMLLDTWNGYPIAREAFLATLATHAANPVVLSGDLHTSMAADLVPHQADLPVAVELMTTSVTSPGFDQYLPQVRPNAVRDATLELNPMLKYMETSRRGWLRVSVDRERCVAEWNLVDSVHSPEYKVSLDQSFFLSAGKIADGLQET